MEGNYVEDEPTVLPGFAADDTKAYVDEGSGSRAGSLQSLNTDVQEKDWRDTVKVLGPKFEAFADFVRDTEAHENSDNLDAHHRTSHAPSETDHQGQRSYRDDSEV